MNANQLKSWSTSQSGSLVAPRVDAWPDLLDTAMARCKEDCFSGLHALLQDLRTLRMDNCDDPQSWRAFCRVARAHPLNELLMRDPFTHHAQMRPRGYPGDAALIDMIYEPGAVLGGLDGEGRDIFRFTSHVAECRAVRARRAIVAQYVDSVAGRLASGRVLSLACGHLREADLSIAHASGTLGHWLALDQDPESVRTAAQLYSDSSAIEPRRVELKEFLQQPDVDREYFDLVYASGLYDYLEDEEAKATTQILFDVLRPGGVLLVGNFLPDPPSIGYMEAFMRWYLNYRDEQSMQRLAQDLPENQVHSATVYREPSDCVVFLDVRKSLA